jgi:hypothetical protein
MAHLTSLFAAILIVDDGNFEKTVESNILSRIKSQNLVYSIINVAPKVNFLIKGYCPVQPAKLFWPRPKNPMFFIYNFHYIITNPSKRHKNNKDK